MITTNSDDPAHNPPPAPAPPIEIEKVRFTRCATGAGFLKTKDGLLNILILIAILCILICVGVGGSADSVMADRAYPLTDIKISAVHTRNAVIVFTVFALLCMVADTILYVTGFINRFSVRFDLIFMIVMFGFAGVYLILGSCAAAWEKKLSDTAGKLGTLKHPGAAGTAAFFIFVAMIAILVNFIRRWIREDPNAES